MAPGEIKAAVLIGLRRYLARVESNAVAIETRIAKRLKTAAVPNVERPLYKADEIVPVEALPAVPEIRAT